MWNVEIQIKLGVFCKQKQWSENRLLKLAKDKSYWFLVGFIREIMIGIWDFY